MGGRERDGWGRKEGGVGGREGKAITCAGLVRALNLLKCRILQGKDTQRSFIHSTNTHWTHCCPPVWGDTKATKTAPGSAQTKDWGVGRQTAMKKSLPRQGSLGASCHAVSARPGWACPQVSLSIFGKEQSSASPLPL